MKCPSVLGSDCMHRLGMGCIGAEVSREAWA